MFRMNDRDGGKVGPFSRDLAHFPEVKTITVSGKQVLQMPLYMLDRTFCGVRCQQNRVFVTDF